MVKNAKDWLSQFVTHNGKVYGICAQCKQVVRIDKPIFGSLHFCT